MMAATGGWKTLKNISKGKYQKANIKNVTLHPVLFLIFGICLLISLCPPCRAEQAPAASPASGINESFFAPGGELDKTSPSDLSVEPGADRTASVIDLPETGFKVFGSLVFVCFLIIAVYKLARKAKLPFVGGDGIVRRIAMQAIGPNQYINVVDIAGKIIVLGMSDKGITKITELDGDARDRIMLASSSHEAVETGAPRGTFRAALQSMGQLVGQRGGSGNRSRPDKMCADNLSKERQRLEAMSM